MPPPQSFYDFTLLFHQDLDLTDPDWNSVAPTGRHDIYNSFRQQYGDEAVRELNAFLDRLKSDEHVDLEDFWFRECKADWIFHRKGIRRLFEDFQAWASSVR